MELTQLRYFLAVADTGNFTRAAERSNITQPSLSQQIINLEREVGHKLFHRLGRKAVLTEAGQSFLGRAKRILFEVEDARKELSDHPNLGRRITVGAVQTVMPYLIAPFVSQCRASHPNLVIHAREDFRANLVRAVVEGELDLAIVPLPIKEPRVSIEPLMTEPLMLVVGRQHPFAQRSTIGLHDLAGETFISLGDSSALAAQIGAFFGDNNFTPLIGFRCGQVATLKRFVSLGLGICILPLLAHVSDEDESLVYLRLADVQPKRELAVIRHLQRYRSRGAEQFLQLLHAHVKQSIRDAETT